MLGKSIAFIESHLIDEGNQVALICRAFVLFSDGVTALQRGIDFIGIDSRSDDETGKMLYFRGLLQQCVLDIEKATSRVEGEVMEYAQYGG